MDLIELKEKIRTDLTDPEAAMAIARLAFGELAAEKHVSRVQRAFDGSIDVALRLVDRIAPGRVIQIVCSQQIFPSAAISPAPPFPANPPMYEGSAPTAGQAILVAMLEAMIQERGGKATGIRPVSGERAPSVAAIGSLPEPESR